MSKWFKAAGICGVALYVSGCAGSTMRTARQLEAGDIVLSGGVDEPGSTFIPRVSGQVMYGIGIGDLSAHLGTSLFAYNAGLGGRFYLGDAWTLALQTEAYTDVYLGPLWNGSMQLTTSVRKRRGLYGGVHALGLGSLARREASNIDLHVGLVGGGDLLLDDNMGMQIEARLSPMIINQDGVGSAFQTSGYTEGGFVMQLGISLYKRWAAAPSIDGSVAEERWNDPGNDFKPLPATRPRTKEPARKPFEPEMREDAPEAVSEPDEGTAPVPPPPD